MNKRQTSVLLSVALLLSSGLNAFPSLRPSREWFTGPASALGSYLTSKIPSDKQDMLWSIPNIGASAATLIKMAAVGQVFYMGNKFIKQRRKPIVAKPVVAKPVVTKPVVAKPVSSVAANVSTVKHVAKKHVAKKAKKAVRKKQVKKTVRKSAKKKTVKSVRKHKKARKAKRK
ncbi:MAG TPA: hypothetical protein VJ201_04760 [Candidatus Babeliales bacterium]|nr:hypothetical protein [Candidatus Babeliales bacterium]